MRVVLDTNILARATPGRSGPAVEVLLRAIAAPHLLVLSLPLLSELSRVLRYERVRRVHGLDDGQLAQYVTHLQENALMVEIEEHPPAVVPHDSDDDPVVATAIAGKADVVCTLDRHLHNPTVRAYCEQHGIRIMTDAELSALLREAESVQ